MSSNDPSGETPVKKNGLQSSSSEQPSGAAADVEAEDSDSSPDSPIAEEPEAEPDTDSPQELKDLASACVGYVERMLGVKLDYLPETLPLLDHYLRAAAKASAGSIEAREIVVLSAGAYFGEVVRRRYRTWWSKESNPADTRIEFKHLFLSFSPMDVIRDAADAYAAEESEEESDEGDPQSSFFDVDDADREVVEARLGLLPPVPEEEFYLPSTRLEVLDIVVEAVRAARVASADPELDLEPEDYE